MAHVRDHRRREFFGVATAALGADFASAVSTADLDQVLYHPRRLVCAPPPEKPTDTFGSLRAAVKQRLVAEGKKAIRERQPADWKVLNRRIFEWVDPDDAQAKRSDSFDLAVDLDRQFPDQVAPVYYSLTQQFAQPGEDPEAGTPVPGLPPLADAAPAADGLGGGIRIAVIDTGIDDVAVNNAPLPKQSYGAQDVDPLKIPNVPGPAAAFLGPCAGHGTFIASLIHCVAPGVTVSSYRVASPLGLAHEEDIATGIRRAVEDGAQIINLSLGGYPFVRNSRWPTLRAFAVLEAAIEAIPAKIAVVAAAGNCGSGAEFYPAAFPGVVGVAALDDCCSNRLWDHSNYGPWVKACTRGVNLRGLFVKGRENPDYDPDGMYETWGKRVNFATWTGTSFAAPLVAAQVAVLAAEMGLAGDTRAAADHLLSMSKPQPDQKACGKRILVDLPGQT